MLRLPGARLFIAGVEQNDRDGVLQRMGTPEQRLSVIREFRPLTPESGELVGTWDIVLGATPGEPRGRGGGPGGSGRPGGPGGLPPRPR